MRIEIVAIGRCRDSEVNNLVDRYAARCAWPITVKELQLHRRLSGDQLKKSEAELLRRETHNIDRIVALDEKGDNLSSRAFALCVGSWQDQGVRSVAFLIGGADGLDRGLCDHASLRLALGRMTWPHLLIRAMLAEQLYRASTILAGHPYHRE
ncbi:MAG: 23S rRNA (pseudouridine(1915)-N(3))-methyltransferase RlmH [Pseudomonadota bacterium]